MVSPLIEDVREALPAERLCLGRVLALLPKVLINDSRYKGMLRMIRGTPCSSSKRKAPVSKPREVYMLFSRSFFRSGRHLWQLMMATVKSDGVPFVVSSMVWCFMLNFPISC